MSGRAYNIAVTPILMFTMTFRLRHIQSRKQAVVWLLLTLLVAGPATPHLVQGAATVLCIGIDGHVEVEGKIEHASEHSPTRSASHSDSGQPVQLAYSSASDTNGKGDCVDVPLVVPDTDHCLSATLAPKLDVDASFAPVILNVPTTVEAASFFSHGYPRPDLFSSALYVRSTVVLLI